MRTSVIRQSDIDEAKYLRMLAEGRGQGTGAQYLPWYRVDEGTSMGRCHTTACDRTGYRVHQLRSNLEYFAFLEQWWDESVLDIQEHYPLIPLERTLALARQRGIRHPKNRRTRFWIPQTADLLATSTTGLLAVSVMEDVAWERPRTQRVFAIAEEFLAAEGVPLILRLGSKLRTQRSLNLQWIYDKRPTLIDPPILEYPDQIVGHILRSVSRYPKIISADLARATDQVYRVEPGTALSAIRRLLAVRILHTDVNAGDISRGCALTLSMKWYGRF